MKVSKIKDFKIIKWFIKYIIKFIKVNKIFIKLKSLNNVLNNGLNNHRRVHVYISFAFLLSINIK